MRKNVIQLLFLLLFACEDTKNSNNKVISSLEDKINEQFITLEDKDMETKAIQVYEDLETFLLEESALKDVSKESYMAFLDQYTFGSSILNFTDLYKKNLFCEYLTMPSNIGWVWYSYSEVLSNNQNQLDNDSSLYLVNQLLNDRKGWVLEDSMVVKKYFDCVTDHQFSNHIVFRIPILSQSFAILNFKFDSIVNEKVNRILEFEKE